jgi:transposase
MVGADGMRLLGQLDAPYTPQGLKKHSEVEIQRRIWEQHYEQIDGDIRILDPKEMSEGARRIESPYEVEARYSTKRSMGWVGYKVHLTESCDEGLPHLITDVHTTAATATDVKQLAPIQEGLAQRTKRTLTRRALGGFFLRLWKQSRFEPRPPDRSHRPCLQGQHQEQAKDDEGFDVANFRIDWEKKMVTCPQRRQSVRWSETETARGRSMIHIDFSATECAACPSRPLCTRAKDLPRTLTLQPKEEHEAIQFARKPKKDRRVCLPRYSHRAGIEGTVSQGVRAFWLRQARYRGLKKTHFLELATATAVNVGRIANWLNEIPTAATRRSRLAALAQAS